MTPDRRSLLAAVGGLAASLCGPATGRDHERPREAAYAPLGTVDVPGARDAVPAGDVVYVAAGNGFVVVDVTDPTAPEILTECREIATDGRSSLSGIWDLWHHGSRLAVAGPANSSRGRPSGVALFDVSEPTDPEQRAFHPTEFPVHNLHLGAERLYLTGHGGGFPLVIVDIGGDSPTEVGRWSPLDVDPRWGDVSPSLRTLHDVSVRNGTASLPYWDAGTWLVDVSDPTDPVAVGRVADYTRTELAAVPADRAGLVARTPRGADHYAQVDDTGTLLAVGRETWTVDDSTGRVSPPDQRVGGASGITLYDVSDPASPERLATIDPPASFDQSIDGWFTTAHNFDFRADRLYTSWYFGGVAVFDVSDPTDPAELARWRDPREASFWSARATSGGHVVASSTDISDIFGAPNGTREAVYIFPDTAGSQAEPPSLTDRPTDLVGDAPADRSPVDRTAASAARVADTTPADDRTDNDPVEDEDATGPGLGVPAALAGLCGAWLARGAGRLNNSEGE